MNPPFAERLRWSAHLDGRGELSSDRAVMARTFGYLYAAGATLVLLTVPLAQPAGAWIPGIVVPPLVAYAGVGLFVIGFDRLPLWSFHAMLVVGVLLLATVVWSGSTAYGALWFWAVLCAFSFFERRHAVMHSAFVAAVWGVVLLLKPGVPAAAVLWVMSVGALFVLGLTIGLLRARLEAVVELLGAAARVDSLTGLANRRWFEERLAHELERARRDDGRLGLVLVDLDDFKRVNDLHGHEAGDEALRRLGAVLRTTTRQVDTAARLGGEEFVLLVTGAGSDAARELAERVRAEVARDFAGGPARLTASFGVASYPQDGEEAQALLAAADEALYLAKARGRDRVVVHG